VRRVRPSKSPVHQRRQVIWLVVRVLVGVGLIGAFLVWWVAPVPDGISMQPGTPNLEVKKVNVRVTSRPSGAEVSVQGNPRGKTPLDLELVAGDASVPVRVELAGYKSVVRDVIPSAAAQLDVTLPKKE
jgi:hypothetical protein